jgi:hypothetical protein
MEVKFENGPVPIYKLRKGILVKYEDDFFHIEYVYRDSAGHIKITLRGAFEEVDVLPKFVDWLEPM